ncbi:MAG: glutamate--tRNA ligase [Firmicutes bacterium]|jgi:glutamyl-tRNA synthetase|nr:glutamate--tRNA ligase [Bacillota bacterium]
MTAKVRVRFAPSPTGFLHVGGARTALFNWLFARHHQGVFVLRIEDTDQVRSTQASVDVILEALRWLGMDWDEGPEKGGPYGPYFQTERLDIYREYAQRLLDEDKAYLCYCTPEELEMRRQEALARGEAPKYDRRCAHLTEAERRQFEEEGRTPVIRFRSGDKGQTAVNDLIRGEVVFENALLDDFVLIKSDGLPTYNYAVVVDDHLMGITHVIRGEDHLSNTPRQIQVYEAFGFPLPQFAHIPMILGPDRTRLSKRHGATSVTQFRDEGYLSEAMVNYLALLGWGYDDKRELFTKEELIKYFALEKVSKNPAIFDQKKLDWMNGVYLRELSVEQLVEAVLPMMIGAGYFTADELEAQRPRVEGICEVLQTRVKTLKELVDTSYYFFLDEVVYDPEAVDKILRKDYVPDLLATLVAEFLRLEKFDVPSIEGVFLRLQEETGRKLGDLIQPVRVAVTGRRVSPGMYETLALVGRPKACQRMKQAAEMAKKPASE